MLIENFIFLVNQGVTSPLGVQQMPPVSPVPTITSVPRPVAAAIPGAIPAAIPKIGPPVVPPMTMPVGELLIYFLNASLNNFNSFNTMKGCQFSHTITNSRRISVCQFKAVNIYT